MPESAASLGVASAPDRVPFSGLLLALQQLDRLLEHAVAVAQTVYGAEAADPYRGLYISSQEAADLLAHAPGSSLLASGSLTLEAFPRLTLLCRVLRLSELEASLLLVALAPELDRRYERLYAFLQNDVTRRRPSVELALGLLLPSFEARLMARRLFAAGAPLIKQQVLRLLEDPADHQPPLLSRYLAVDGRIVNYLLGDDELDDRLDGYVARGALPISIDALLLAPDVKQRLRLLLRHGHSAGIGLTVYLQGPYGVGKHTVAAALCHELGLGMLTVDGERMARLAADVFAATLRLALREAALGGEALYFEGFDTLLGDEQRQHARQLLGALAERGAISFLAGDVVWEPTNPPPGLAFVRVELPKPCYSEREELWSRALSGGADGAGALPARQDLSEIASRFRFSAGQIRDAAASAHNLARWRSPELATPTHDDLIAASQLQSNRHLSAIARKLTPHYVWDDLVLPADRLLLLREICQQVQHRTLVYEAWGYDRKLSLGKGLNVLFAGPSGTGKTMAAEIMAGELKLDLYKIDLSTVVSKYIGETEKNLARVFAEAATSHAMLFFDEADALFGKRSEVRDSHDRYANLEIAYLLQRMEEYEGIVILATNMRKNMDDAFVRRMQFMVEFPFPDSEDRLRIWQSIWPEDVPREPTLDLVFLAERFEIAGGNIRNVALAAAFLAAADGRPLHMEHLVHAVRREYQKTGKMLTGGEFGVYGAIPAKNGRNGARHEHE